VSWLVRDAVASQYGKPHAILGALFLYLNFVNLLHRLGFTAGRRD
jgi:hypothetical protein